jgi:hypothetical protein
MACFEALDVLSGGPEAYSGTWNVLHGDIKVNYFFINSRFSNSIFNYFEKLFKTWPGFRTGSGSGYCVYSATSPKDGVK